MIGEQILEKTANLRLEGLLDGDELPMTILAAVFADALRKGQTPRQILDATWQSVPSDEAWNNGLEERVVAALDAFDSRPAEAA